MRHATGSHARPLRQRRVLVFQLLAVALPIALYLAYIDHYAVNALWEDDWSRVPMLDGFTHGHGTFGLLWGQYNEQRLFVPNVIFVVLAHLDHFNTKVVVLIGAAMFAASYLCILAAQRRILGSLPATLPLLLIGVVWFSLADDESALWAIQFSWYVVLVCFGLLLLLLSGMRLTWWMLGVGLVAATVASCSALQGLMLWPVGLFCLVWRARRADPASRPETKGLRMAIIWAGSAVAVGVVYFAGFHFNDLGARDQ